MIPGSGMLIHYRRDRLPTSVFLDFSCGSAGKESAAMQETWVQSLDWEDPLEEERLPTPVFWPAEFQRGSNKLTDKQERTHGQMAYLQSQVELRDHRRNWRSQPLGSAAPSFSGRRLCPDGLRKTTNCYRLTSSPTHCCSLISHGPNTSRRTSPPLPLIPA